MLGMLSLLEQLREAFASVLRQPRSTTVPASDQTRDGFGGRFGRTLSASRTQRFQRLPHHLRLGAAGLPRYSLKQGSHFRIDPDVEITH
jgi:hypothetical protein